MRRLIVELFATDRVCMAEETAEIELGEYSVEVSQEHVEHLGYRHSGTGEVSYYTVTSDTDCLELMVDGAELSSTAAGDDTGKDEITILTADGQFITDGVGQLIHCDVDGTDAAATGQPLVLNLAHPMGTRRVFCALHLISVLRPSVL